MRPLRLFLCFLATFVAGLRADPFVWTGAAGDGQYSNPANWSGNIVPPNNGSATLVFGDLGAGVVTIPPFAALSLDQIQILNTAGADYTFSGIALITVQNGFVVNGNGSSRFMGGVALNLSGNAQTFSVTGGSLNLSGPVIGGANLIKKGPGNLILSGINLYAGGTLVESGSLTFTSPSSVPAWGQIEANSSAYVGVTFTSAIQTTFLDRIDGTHYAGTIGFDTNEGQAAPAVFAESINVSSLGLIAGIGTQTSARLTGQIQIGSGQNYRFTGTGTLYVESNLTVQNSKVIANSTFGAPLTLVLRGNNSFTGGIDILNSLVVLDGGKTLAPLSPTTPGRLLNLLGPGYVSSTENFLLSPNGFLSRIGTIASSESIVGFDSANPSQTRVINQPVDLSLGGLRTDPHYLGTSTSVTLTGTITPTIGDSLYLTAVKGGQLTVASNLGGNIPSLVVGQANPFEPQGGTVELTGQNSFSGGTQIKGGILRAGSGASLGTGPVTVSDRATLTIPAGVNIANTISLLSGSSLNGAGVLSAPGGVTIANGAHLSPGGQYGFGNLTFSSGLTLASGGIFDFNIGSATGTAGSQWDLFSVGGSGLVFSGSPVTISLNTLLPDGSSGPLLSFNNAQSYSWQFASSNLIVGFSSGSFAVNTSNFLNDLGGGSFFVSQTGNSLALNFTPVPEPATYALMAVGLGFVVVFELRRRKRQQ